jgi:hypothetical protein
MCITKHAGYNQPTIIMKATISIVNKKGANILAICQGEVFDEYDKTTFTTRTVYEDLVQRYGSIIYNYKINGKTVAPPPPASPIAQVEDIFDPNIVDIATGEVLTPMLGDKPQARFINPLNSNEMKTTIETVNEIINSNPVNEMNTDAKTTESTVDQTAHTAEPISDTKASTPIADMVKANKPMLKRLRTGGAKGAEIGVKIATDPIITGLILTADAIYKVAEGIAWTQAGAIHVLKTHPEMTARQLKEGAMDRNQNRLDTMYAIPTGALQAVKALKFIKQMQAANLTVQPTV